MFGHFQKQDGKEKVDGEIVTVKEPQPLVVVEEVTERTDVTEQEAAVNRVELDLTTAAAAVAQLKLEQKPVVEVTGGESTSFEVLDLRERIPPKVSQTATPTNTPHGTLNSVWSRGTGNNGNIHRNVTYAPVQ